MIGTLFNLVLYVVAAGLLLWLLQYLINELPMFEPFRKFANIILTVFAVLFLVVILLSLTGTGDFRLPRFG